MWGDLRHACRSILRMPALSAVVVVSLGAGIGINTVVFSWVQARILDPIPGVDDGAGVRLIEPRSEAGLYTGASWPEFRDMREREIWIVTQRLVERPRRFNPRVRIQIGETLVVERLRFL